MKTFEDLEFKDHPNVMGGVRAKIHFANGFGASVVKTPYSYGGRNGLYELAVLDKDGQLLYDTPVTSDVLGYLTPEEVTEYMKQVQSL